VVKYLPSKCKAMSPNPSTTKKRAIDKKDISQKKIYTTHGHQVYGKLLNVTNYQGNAN
jgi:hypothetical protein